MTDIYVGIAGMVFFGLASFHASRRLCSRWSRRVHDGLALITVLLLLAYIRWCWNDPRLTWILPYSNLVIIGNWFPLFVGGLAGLVWGRFRDSTSRRWATIVLLLGVGAYSTLSPVLGQPPQCADQWEGDLCLQSTMSTCSPAAAATLLRHYGIQATEQEMAELCLTRDGTTWMGLYRGLKLKTAGTAWDVELVDVDRPSAGSLPPGPILLCVMLKPGSERSHEYQVEWGWIPDVAHSVVYMRQTRGGSYQVVDPSVGIENWTREDVNVLWHGEGVRLVRRSPNAAQSPLGPLLSLASGS